ncbi:MAG TPA: hypothetical protein VII96_03400 [Acidimicrobiales bacterium]
MDERDQTSIAIVGRTTAPEIGERVEVEWSLSVEPGLEWAEVFQFASVEDREGPVDWMEGAGPDVVGGTVRWFVPTASLDNAEAEVLHRLRVANERCLS